MSGVRFYHYEPSRKEPQEYNFSNGRGWRYCFDFLFSELAIDKGLVELKPETAALLRDPRKINVHYRNLVRTQLMVDTDQAIKAYNSLQQRGDVEKWQKIAMGFLGDYTLVLDQERKEVVDSLRKTVFYLKGNPQTQGFDAEIINGPANTILRLNQGPVIVTTSHEDPEVFDIHNHTLEELLQIIPQATSIPRLM